MNERGIQVEIEIYVTQDISVAPSPESDLNGCEVHAFLEEIIFPRIIELGESL